MLLMAYLALKHHDWHRLIVIRYWKEMRLVDRAKTSFKSESNLIHVAEDGLRAPPPRALQLVRLRRYPPFPLLGICIP